MHELDLIPADYRERERIQQKCTIFIGILIVLVVALAGLRFVLQQKVDTLQLQIQALEDGKKIKLEQQQKFNALLAQERMLNKRLEIFNGLRGGLSAKQLFLAIDRVMDGDVWFNEWKLLRTSEINAVKTIHSTSGLVIPESENSAGQAQAWQLSTRMEITGQALDHSKLAAFVSRLMQQPEVQDVKVLNTNLKTYLSNQVIDFNMVVIINNHMHEDHD
ncbi:MAG: PilN domain-containing protein [Methylococcales bacterium]|nr:PilN domain-containing protein [Methylococcales bacterium]